MKYNDIEGIEAKITANDYVINDVKPRASFDGVKRRFRVKKKGGRLVSDKVDLFMVPVLVLTAVSLGFLIAQIAEIAGLSAVATILT